MKTIEGSVAKPMAFPQHCKAYATEKGRVRGCLRVPQAHIFLKPFSRQMLQTERRHFWGDESLYPELVAPVAIRSCGPRAALASGRVPGSGSFCVSPRLGCQACLPHHLAIVLNLWGRRSSPCPGRGQITDFRSFDSVLKFSFEIWSVGLFCF